MLNFEKHFEKIKKIKNLAQYFKDENLSKEKLNAFMKKKQNIMGLLFILTFIFAMIVLHHVAYDENDQNKKIYIHSLTSKNNLVPDGVLTTDFTTKNNLSALEQQQSQIDQLGKAVSVLLKDSKNKNSRNSVDNKDNISSKSDQITLTAKNQIAHNDARNSLPFSSAPRTDMPTRLVSQNDYAQLISEDSSFNTISFHYEQEKIKPHNNYGWHQNPHLKISVKRRSSKNPNTWVPAGTFDRVVLLVGADANASVNGQSDTSPILMRFLDQGTLPNGYHSHLKGCFALASVYGDISSERGEARLNKISCTQKDGSILEMQF